jgi:hypothetical protein
MRLALQISEQLEPLKKMSVAKRHVRQLGGGAEDSIFRTARRDRQRWRHFSRGA